MQTTAIAQPLPSGAGQGLTTFTPEPVTPKAEAYRRAQALRHAQQGQRLLDRRDYDQAVYELALSYIFDARPEQLFIVARACHHADLDAEALSIYQQLQDDHPQGALKMEINDAISGLQTKMDDPEIALPRALRRYLEQGRRHFQEGLFLQSAREYVMAYLMRPLPRLLFNIAQSYRRANRMDDAYVMYSLFGKAEEQTPLRKEAIGYLEELRPVVFRPPLYKRAWLWGIIGAVTVAAVAGSAGLAVGLRPKYPQTDAPPEVLMFSLTLGH